MRRQSDGGPDDGGPDDSTAVGATVSAVRPVARPADAAGAGGASTQPPNVTDPVTASTAASQADTTDNALYFSTVSS